METTIIVIAIGQVITAGVLLSVVITLGKHRRAIDNLLESVKVLSRLALKADDIFKLIAEFVSKKKK